MRDARRARWRRWTRPGTAAGPSLRELVLGSEGALGVITRVALRVRPLRVERVLRRLVGRRRSLEGADAAARARAGRARARHRAALRRGGDAAQRRAGRRPGALGRTAARTAAACWCCGWEGARRAAPRRRGGWCAAARGRSGPQPGHAWAASRFAGPAPARRPDGPRRARRDARDGDVLEQPRARSTARCAARCRAATSAATSRTSIRPAPRCTSRCSARQADDPVAQWRAVKAAATRAIVAAGGTITHHHAIGRDHAPVAGRRGRRARARAAARGQGRAATPPGS